MALQAQRPATLAAPVTPPRQQFGFDIGDDYRLVNYTQYVEYLRKLDSESDRLSVVDIGPTAEGRRQYLAIVTSPENHKRLAEYQEANRRLALAEGLTDDEARQLARRSKVVVWIDGGLHATEVLGAQQLIETVYRLTSRTDDETTRILQDDIVLLSVVNPDGMQLVADWYMREPDESRRSTSGLPRLYQKYIGHDNNRDFYMMTQPESENVNRVLYREWYPAIVYNHHQSGPPGAVLFAPPFRDPFNYHFDSLIPLGIETVGAAIHTRLAVEGKPGAVMRSAAPYSTWWNGGLRTTAYFHNQIGILTEMIGDPSPIDIPFVPQLQLRTMDTPNPIAPQPWHFRQSIEYSLTANYAVLDVASKQREDFLFNMYRMGKNAIAKGSTDSWTIQPRGIEAVRAEAQKLRPGAGGRSTAPDALYERVLRDPSSRDPRGYVLSADQPDFLTATKFVNALIKAGIVVHRARQGFTAGGRSYPAGSYLVKTAQAFRAHVMDMFEPQDYPNDFRYAGGPPVAPYDATGYNLSYSMGLQFDRILDAFEGPFEALTEVVRPRSRDVEAAPAGGAYVLSRDTNDTFRAVNQLLRAGESVHRLRAAVTIAGRLYQPGTRFVTATPAALALLRELAAGAGLPVETISTLPAADLMKLRPVRIGLWDEYGGSVPSGWTRWLLEQFEFPFEVVFAKALDRGALAERYDVLIFVTGSIPDRDSAGNLPLASTGIPGEHQDRLGAISVARTVPHLKAFVEAGGTLLAVGSSTVIGRHLGLPIQDALAEQTPAGSRPLPVERFFVPGSLLEARVDVSHPIAHGLSERAMVFFDHSPAFRLPDDAAAAGIRQVLWFDTASPLRSGWAWGQRYLQGSAAVVEAPLGSGRLVLFGPEIAWRAQTHGTFKLLFNAIDLAAARSDGERRR